MRVVNADSVDATELAVVCVGEFVVVAAGTCVAAPVLAAWVDAVVAALYSADKLLDCDDAEIELIDISYPTRWFTHSRSRQVSTNLEGRLSTIAPGSLWRHRSRLSRMRAKPT
jgi:hypothetical protein